MVGGKVRNDRPGWAALHVHELEGAELHHGEVPRLHLPHQRQQGRSDVTPQPDGFARRLQHLGDQRGSGGLSVGAGNRQQRAGANLEENLHFAGDFRPPLSKRFNGRIRRVHTGGAEYNIRFHAVQIRLPHMELTARFFQCQHLIIQLLPGGFVTANYVTAKFQQELDEGAVADTQPQHRDFFILQRRKVFFKFAVHIQSPFLWSLGIV